MKTLLAWLGIFAALGIVVAGVVKNGTPAARSVVKKLANRRAEMAAKRELNGLIYVAGDGFSLHADSGASYQDILAHRANAKYFTLQVFDHDNSVAFGRDVHGFWIAAGCDNTGREYFTRVNHDPVLNADALFVLSSDEMIIRAREDERSRTDISLKYKDESRFNPPVCSWILGDNRNRIAVALDMIRALQ